MKAVIVHAVGAVALTFGVAACIAGAVPAEPQSAATASAQATNSAQVAPAPRAPAPTPPPVQQPRYDNYLDAPQTPGDWSYGQDPDETRAIFGQSPSYEFMLRCNTQTRRIRLIRNPQIGRIHVGFMTVTTETTERQFQTTLPSDSPGLLTVELDPRDPLLDAIAITKGRFAVAVEGQPTLYLPAWVEVSRVIEDCR